MYSARIGAEAGEGDMSDDDFYILDADCSCHGLSDKVNLSCT